MLGAGKKESMVLGWLVGIGSAKLSSGGGCGQSSFDFTNKLFFSLCGRTLNIASQTREIQEATEQKSFWDRIRGSIKEVK